MKDRVVYTSAEKQAMRGVAASASVWGWCWVKTSDGTLALYTSAGVAVRHHKPSGWSRNTHGGTRAHLDAKIVAYRCLQCGYTEASLVCHEDEAKIPPRPSLCLCCKEDAVAIHALEVQELCGVDLGWRKPASIGEAESFTRSERLRWMGARLDTREGVGEAKPRGNSPTCKRE